MTVRVLAVADSDSYLKWACATLDRLGAPDDVELERSAVIVRTPLVPTPSQVAAAVAGTSIVRPRVLGLGALSDHVRTTKPDVVLVAATGPVAEMVARVVVRVDEPNRPALVTGLPGMALPATPLGAGWRRWCDAFVVHGRAEVEAYREAFAAQGATPHVVLTRLPFLERRTSPAGGPVRRVVFAPQSLVPAGRAERVAILDGLAATAGAGYDVVVKLRARAGERQTHNEAHPFDALWDAEHARLGHRRDLLRFVDGPMTEWLDDGTALVTVSSTAALESLALGVPTVLLDDFGVSDELLNAPFAASGCLASLADLPDVLADGGPVPDATWLEENYLHSEPSELPQTVRALAARHAEGTLPALGGVRPVSWPHHARTVVRSLLPDAVARRLVRPVR
jgi:hypothetical protein